MMKYFFWLLLPILSFAQTDLTPDQIKGYLTSSTWNIAYNISPEGERIEEESAEKIRAAWVKFNSDGTYEMPNNMGKTFGKWTYNPSTQALHFNENGVKYRAIIEEISDLGLLLNYVDNGGFKIGLIHHIHIPKEKSSQEITKIITSGKWNLVIKRSDGMDAPTAPENMENTWYQFNEDYTYQTSEVIGEDILTHEGTWFIDSSFQLNLDADEMQIYSVVGDNSRLILTSNTDGIRILEFRKAK
jgi:hypothetical protein